MNKVSVGSDHKCLVCGTGDLDKPMCYRKEPWCNESHRQVIMGERHPTADEATSMSEGLALRFGRGPVRDFIAPVYDADDDEYWPEETRTVFPIEK